MARNGCAGSSPALSTEAGDCHGQCYKSIVRGNLFLSTTALVTTLQSSFSLLSAAGFPIPQDVSYITEVLFCIRIKVCVGDKYSILALVYKKNV